MQPPLSPDEEQLLGHYRRLKKTYKDWTLTCVGQFRSGRQQVRLIPAATYLLTTGVTEAQFDALD